MRYHYEKPDFTTSMYGRVYICNHPIYDRCTLYELSGKGLAVIQQRYDPTSKTTKWSSIDPWIVDPIYLHIGFKEYFDRRAGECIDGLFPTVTVRQLMWALRMKPMPKERWETTFDRRDI